MRFWIVILMILFAPLRGMAADMMAISMAGQQRAPTQHGAPAATPAQAPAAAALSDCAEHHAVPVAPSAQPAQDGHAALPDGDCPTCASCMVCSSAALALASVLPPAVPVHHAVPAPGSNTFRSAAPLPGFKPPIS